MLEHAIYNHQDITTSSMATQVEEKCTRAPQAKAQNRARFSLPYLYQIWMPASFIHELLESYHVSMAEHIFS